MNLHVDISGQGPDLVLLHGWAMHGGVFAELLPALTENYRVHRIDLPGHGQSAAAAGTATLEQLTAAVRPHVPINALVLGWSLGGLVALHLAQLQAVRALVLVSTTPRFVAAESWPQGMSPLIFAQFFTHLQRNLSATVEDFLRLQVRGDAAATRTFATLKNSLLQHPAEAQSLQITLGILRDADMRVALPHIQAPALVLAGEYDRITHPDAGEYLAAQLPQARFELVKRAGHAPFLSHREEFLLALRPFLASHAATGLTHG